MGAVQKGITRHERGAYRADESRPRFRQVAGAPAAHRTALTPSHASQVRITVRLIIKPE